MDWPVVLAKITGILLFLWTLRSIYRHVKEKREARRQNRVDTQSVSELILNNILLYAWLAFMVVFSIGMVVNN
jgi:Na+/melibiose symporter-like transporter